MMKRLSEQVRAKRTILDQAPNPSPKRPNYFLDQTTLSPSRSHVRRPVRWPLKTL